MSVEDKACFWKVKLRYGFDQIKLTVEEKNCSTMNYTLLLVRTSTQNIKSSFKNATIDGIALILSKGGLGCKFKI